MFISSLAGQWAIAGRDDLVELVQGRLEPDRQIYMDFESRGFLRSVDAGSTLAPTIAQIRTKKAWIFEGPSLHIFVVTLRCNHSCSYCQVSREPEGAGHFDLEDKHADDAVTLLFKWPSKNLTVEFQGGEPLLAFPRIRRITERILSENTKHRKNVSFVVATTLQHLTQEMLEFFATHDFKLSTSLDGPAELHNANRPLATKDSYQRTLSGVAQARDHLGQDRVSALTTITKRSLAHPEAIVDEYAKNGFHSIFLRPLSPYGFARSGKARLAYTTAEFSAFYKRAFDRILQHNLDGYHLEEAYASLLLGQLLTPFSNGYVDIRSPTGAAFGAIVYDFDGGVYASDEARMLAAMGDTAFRLGSVTDSIATLLTSAAMQRVLRGAIAESIPQCSECAFVPFCGADPVDSYARQGDEVGHRPSSEFCGRQMSFFDYIVGRWVGGSPEERAVMSSWVKPRGVVRQLEVE